MRGGPSPPPPGRPVDRSPGAPSDLNPPSALPEWGMVMGGFMGGVAPILFWFAAVCRPQAWSARRFGELVRARPSTATPPGAGGWGRWGARCAGPAASPHRIAVPFGGGGASSRLWGGGALLLWPSSWGGERGGGWGDRSAAPRPPAPSGVALPSVVSGAPPRGILVLSGLPGGRGHWARPGRPPMGQCGGGGREGGGHPPALVRAPAFPRPASEGAAPFASRAPPVRRRSAAGRAGACGRFTGAACRGRSAPSPRVQRPLRGGCGAAVPSACLCPLLGLRERGGGERGGASDPLTPPLTAAGGRPCGPGPGGQPSAGGSHSSPAPRYLARAGPSCRRSLGSPVPPAIAARRWPAEGGHEG